MATLLFVTSASSALESVDPPASFQLLPHQLTVVCGADEALAVIHDHQLVLVDGRSDPAAARELCQQLTSLAASTPLLLLGAATLPVLSRQWGMSDFILDTATSPEVDARIRLLLERPAVEGALRGGPVVIDESAYTATVSGRVLDLTYTEFELLKYLVQHPGRVLSREQLLSEVWGYDYYGGTRTVDVHIRRLRAKLGTEFDYCIGTVRNVGYRFCIART